MLEAKSLRRLKQWAQQNRQVLLSAIGVTGLVILLRFLGGLESSELAALDQLARLRPSEPIDDRVVIVEIDEADLQQIGRWPIPDRIMAQLLGNLNTYQPRAIGFDIYRDLPVPPGHADFVSVAKAIPNLVVIEKLADKTQPGVSPPSVLQQSQQVGFNNVVVDPDGKVRRSLLYWHVEGVTQQSFALKLALLYLKPEGIEPQPAPINPAYLQLGQGVFPSIQPNTGGYVQADSKGYQVLINPRRSPGFRKVSLRDVLAKRVPKDLLRSRIVLIGSTAPSLKDLFSTVGRGSFLDEAQPIFGVELHASFISQILSTALDERPLLNSWSEPKEALWIFLWSGLGASLIWRTRSPRQGLVALLLAGVFLGSSCYLALLMGWWLPLVPGLLGLLGAAAVSMSYIAHIQDELRRSKEFLQTVINAIPDPVFVKDKNHRWIILNQAYCQFVGYPRETLMEKSDYDLFPPQEAKAFWTEDEQVFQTGSPCETEEELTDAFGTTHLTATKKSLHKDAAGNLFLVGVIRDITKRKQAEEELRQAAAELSRSNTELKRSEDHLRYLAYHDPLTGLANRKQFHERLNQALDWARSNQQLVALMFLDLDGFKQVNDTLGHDVGDRLLKVVAQRLTSGLRSSDIVSRLGGDEFTVILSGIPQAEYAAKVANKVLETLSQVFVLDGHSVFVTVSIGISIYPLDGDVEEVLLKKADTAMYCAKQQGRNQAKFSEL